MGMLISVSIRAAVTTIVVVLLRVIHLFRVRITTGWSFNSYLNWIAVWLDARPHDFTTSHTNNFLDFLLLLLLNVSVDALLTFTVARKKVFESYVWFFWF